MVSGLGPLRPVAKGSTGLLSVEAGAKSAVVLAKTSFPPSSTKATVRGTHGTAATGSEKRSPLECRCSCVQGSGGNRFLSFSFFSR